MSKIYFAYGSNLNLRNMKKMGPGIKCIGKTFLNDYRLVYKGICSFDSYLTIEPCKDKRVPIGVYKISKLNEFLLDRYEGYPILYSKSKIQVKLYGKIISGMIYIMKPKYDYNIPSLEYIKMCKQGYKNFEFSNDILDEALQYTLKKKANSQF